MTPLVSLIPVYLMGNLHCLGMCGPLVVMLGRHRYRYGYFIGRLLSFSTVGALAGWVGNGLDLGSIQPLVALLFGVSLCLVGIAQLLPISLPSWKWLHAKRSGLDQKLTLLLLRDRPETTFLFGLATVLLPCGQSLLVFSASALTGSPLLGLFNAFVFALLTSPSLFLAMKAHRLLQSAKQYYRPILALVVILAGLWMSYRGFAGLQLAPPPCEMCDQHR